MGWRPGTEKWAAFPGGAFREIKIARRGGWGGALWWPGAVGGATWTEADHLSAYALRPRRSRHSASTEELVS